MTESDKPTYRRTNAKRSVRLTEVDSGIEANIMLAGGAIRFCVPSGTRLYDLVYYMKGPDSNTPFSIFDENGVSLQIVSDKVYFDIFHISLNSNGILTTFSIDDDEDRLALILGLERELAAL